MERQGKDVTWRKAVNEQTQNHQTQTKVKVTAEVVGPCEEGHQEIWGGGEMEGRGYGLWKEGMNGLIQQYLN